MGKDIVRRPGFFIRFDIQPSVFKTFARRCNARRCLCEQVKNTLDFSRIDFHIVVYYKPMSFVIFCEDLFFGCIIRSGG